MGKLTTYVLDTARRLAPVPLTAERFAPYGDVIAVSPGARRPMNTARFDRFADLAMVDVDSAAAISIVRSNSPTRLPYHFDMVERHVLGSQAFVPLDRSAFVVVVAPPGESVDPADLRAFVTNGSQGISYHRGTWHMPLIALDSGQQFLVVDRSSGDGNCEEHVFEHAVVLEAPR
jgi:ureidoglycolate lyase